MAFFDKVSELAKNASDKTNVLIETTKLNNKVSNEEKNIASVTAKIGEYFVSKLDEGASFDAAVMDLYTEITASRSNIKELEAQIAELKEEKPAEAAPTAAATASKFCPSCGAGVSAETKFCPSCGAKIEA